MPKRKEKKYIAEEYREAEPVCEEISRDFDDVE